MGRTPSATRARPELGHGGAADGSLVVVSNRLPVRFDEPTRSWVTTAGGLVSAMLPVLERYDGTWIGWNPGRRPIAPLPSLHLRGVSLPADLAMRYYAGYANSVLWPTLHGMQERVECRRGWWDAYRAANDAFADAVVRTAREGDTVWVHDYHLLLVPTLVAQRRPDLTVALFLHTPVADAAALRGLAHCDELLTGMAGAKLIGTQTPGDAAQLACLLDTVGRPHLMAAAPRIGAYPVSIDVRSVVELARDPAVRLRSAQVRTQVGAGRTIVLGVDRLDYTKGILERLAAFEKLLELGLVSADEVVLVQIAPPTRTEVAAYRDLADCVQSRVRSINQRFSSRRGPAVVLRQESLPFDDVMAHYLAADVATVTPVRDGMNLVAKEYVVARAGDPVCLVLGAGAGAVEELGSHAVVVDASDPLDLAAGLHEALQLGRAERIARSTALGRIVASHDVHAWAAQFLGDLRASARLEHVGAA